MTIGSIDYFDDLGNYDDDQTLADIGLTQPPKRSAGLRLSRKP